MKHLGDITKIKGSEAPTVDCITGGSPCQDLSVAGKRAGLAGERSGLFMEQIRLIKEMREHDKSAGRLDDNIRPRWMVWENVPGAFSSNGGEDFRAVLEETARVKDPDAIIPRPADGKWTPAGCIMGDGWSVAWRVHDAQFWGVPQRRRRISLVADFAGGGAPEVLFERKSVSRDFETGDRPREETAGDAGGGIESAKQVGITERHSICYDARGNGSGKIAPTITGDHQNRVTDYTAIVISEVGESLYAKEPILLESNQNHATIQTDGISTSLPASMGMGGGYIPMVMESYGFDPQRKAESMGFTEETAASLVNGTNTGHHIGVLTFTRERSDKYSAGEIISTIGARDYKGATDLIRDCGVRRLTPTECERLQGYPDGWTDIGEWTDSKGKKHNGDADAPRYKALGNSIALPFWFWLLRRISATYCRPATLGSLFDGIGGFPLCWERCNGKGTAIWASEIEEFPIAVTKRHFAEETEK